MSKKDYAIVIGVRRYPRFGRTDLEAADLQGPDNDASAVYDWLVDPMKGGVPRSHVWRVQSSKYPDPFKSPDRARPTGEDIERLFDKLERIAEKNNREGRGATVGRRLYVYVAGHGFAPRLKQAAIFTAPATRDKTLNFWATSWVEALYARRWFEEYVLWMDCCMSFELSAVASPAPYRETQATGTPPKLFTAFAARRPQEAVEKQMPDGQVHGVFTWTLLQGLNGAAADDDGTITTAGLKNYLSNAMRTWLSEEELADDRIAQEPDFGSEDLIVLAGGESPTEFNAELKFESALVGRPFVVLDGDLKQIAAGDAAGATTLQLRPGMYAVVVDGTTRQFEVLSDVRVSVG